MPESHRRSIAVLIGVAILMLVGLAATGRLSPKFSPDSIGYITFDWSAPLSQARTVGYPLLLGLLNVFGEKQAAVPLAHWMALTLSCIVFYWGLCRMGFRQWTAAWCAIVTLLGRGVWDWGNQVIADSLAISLAIAATGCFLAAIAAGTRSRAFVSCVLLTFVAYQVRPAFLFLLPLWPLAALLPQMWVAPFPGWKVRFRTAAMFAAGTALPFLAFCAFRAVMVGHFGLVSFGGANIVGVAGQFLDEGLVPQLSEDVQPLANDILQKRDTVADYQTPGNFLAMEAMFNPTVWEMAVPAGKERYGDDEVALNQALTSLSHQVLKVRRKEYARWLLWNLNHARQQLIQLTAFDKGTLVAALLFLVAHLWGLKRPVVSVAASQVAHRERHILFWLALLFAAGKTALVVLVEPANDRYMTPAMVLWPAVITVFCAQYAGTMFRIREDI